jgi:urease accessory protein UreF
MTIVAAALLVAFAVPWSLLLVWVFGRITERAVKHALVRQRLAAHSSRLTERENLLRAEVIHDANETLRALRYTSEHRREAKQLGPGLPKKLRQWGA